MNIIIYTMLIFVIAGCGGGISDIYEDISNKYVYIDESPMQKMIIFEEANSLLQQEKNYIPCKILQHKHNKQYIIAKIKFHYDIYCGTTGFTESKILKEGEIYYYIIDAKNHIRYGAFKDKKKYLEKKKNLNIKMEL